MQNSGWANIQVLPQGAIFAGYLTYCLARQTVTFPAAKQFRLERANLKLSQAIHVEDIERSAEFTHAARRERMLIVLIILLLVFGFGGYRMGPGLGYYGGGGISLILLIVIILLLLRVI